MTVSPAVHAARERLEATRRALAQHYPCRHCVQGRREGMCATATQLYGAQIAAINALAAAYKAQSAEAT